MAIRFRCPSCKKSLTVKDEMAGRRAACPVCKKGFKIPAPRAKAADVEALAAATLSDEPQQQQTEEQQPPDTFEFTCPFCDEEVKVAADMAGKREPCPSCKQILKVPVPQEEKPKDWRTVDQVGPSAALANVPEQLEGAWGSTTDRGRVHKESLADADVLTKPEPPPRRDIGPWVGRVFWVVAIGFVLFFVVRNFYKRRVEVSRKGDLQHALEAIAVKKDQGTEALNLPRTWVAEIHRGIGEFYARTDKAEDAKDQFRMAQSRFSRDFGRSAVVDVDREMMLIRLARSQILLGGDEDQVYYKKRLEWKKEVREEVLRTLERLGSDFFLAIALRQVGSDLLAKDQSGVIIGLATTTAPTTDLNRRASRSLLAAQYVAFLLSQKDKKLDSLAANSIIPPKSEDEIRVLATRLAYAEGHARKGEWQEAVKIAEAPGRPIHAVHAALVVADLMLMDDADHSNEIFALLNTAVKVAERVTSPIPPGLKLYFIQVAARAGKIKEAASLAKKLPPPYRPWGQLAVFQAKLDAIDGSVPVLDAINAITYDGDPPLAAALAWEAWARHNTQVGDRGSVDNQIDLTEDKRLRPFLYLGAALGGLG